MERYGVIMAGGGERFGHCRLSAPKQFLNITGEDSMINNIKRISGVFPTEQVLIVTIKDGRDIK